MLTFYLASIVAFFLASTLTSYLRVYLACVRAHTAVEHAEKEGGRELHLAAPWKKI